MLSDGVTSVEDKLSEIAGGTVVDYKDLTNVANIGTIYLKLYANGLKSLLIQSNAVPATRTVTDYIIPEKYRPSQNYFGAGSTWNNALYRRGGILTDGRVEIAAVSSDSGFAFSAYYI